MEKTRASRANASAVTVPWRTRITSLPCPSEANNESAGERNLPSLRSLSGVRRKLRGGWVERLGDTQSGCRACGGTSDESSGFEGDHLHDRPGEYHDVHAIRQRRRGRIRENTFATRLS